ncbi:hypothetical protein [Alteraurantiacibacter aquimixticola]|uniref:Uncharacterized protein n=1 Tax=Alteraurantiacibacter aquimixticola TaxID=2489173 RepID=A0A4T3EZP8_9SPHN|nr:hypothetical protein [Alteraurantiacibacter aquimixticola]TIX49624.1 hypothetical protein E5222_12395 [Alteraurantiacibacter aquimixticola]
MPIEAALEKPANGSRIALGKVRLNVRHFSGRWPPAVPDEGKLARSLGRAFDRLADSGDSSFWVIRHLRASTRVAGDIDPDGLADAAAASLAEALRKVLRGEVVVGVRRYSNRAAWLADLLIDHASGLASGHWAYARHRQLEALPIRFIPRQLLAAEPFDGPKAFVQLADDGRLPALLFRLREDGAKVLWQTLADLAPREFRPASTERFEAILLQCLARDRARPHAATVMALTTVLAESGIAGLPAPNRTRAIVANRLVGPRRSESAVVDANPRTNRQVHEPGPLPPDRPPPKKPTTDEDHSDPQSPIHLSGIIETPFAGVFLLWRSVVELGLEAIFPPHCDRGAAALTLAAALTGPAREDAWHDPALHWLAGYFPADTDKPLAADGGMSERTVDLWTQWRAPRRVETCTARSGRLTLVQDVGTEDWLACGSSRECAVATRRVPHPATGRPVGMRDPRVDIDWLGARNRTHRPWAVLARLAYGDFARRLSGLERSSACWLWPNLLSGWGSLEISDRSTASLARVPLDLVLRMAGVDGMSVTNAGGEAYHIRLPGGFG